MSASVTVHQGNSYPISSGVINVTPSGDWNVLNVDSAGLITIEPPTAFCFSAEGKQFSLSFKDGVLKVETDMEMDESAKRFFEYFKQNVDAYIHSIMPHDNLKYLEWLANEGKHAK